MAIAGGAGKPCDARSGKGVLPALFDIAGAKAPELQVELEMRWYDPAFSGEACPRARPPVVIWSRLIEKTLFGKAAWDRRDGRVVQRNCKTRTA